jgi:hypothetical protein
MAMFALYAFGVNNLGTTGYKAPQRIRTHRRAVARARTTAAVRLRKWAERNAQNPDVEASPQVVQDALWVLEELERAN